MSKKILAIALAMMILFLVGCGSDNSGGENGGDMNNSGGENGSTTRGDEFVLKAVVKAVTNGTVEAEVIESDYAFGIYWVRTGENTQFSYYDGSAATIDDISAGDTVEISYNGQVMMSYPPQIVALRIVIQ